MFCCWNYFLWGKFRFDFIIIFLFVFIIYQIFIIVSVMFD
jgi:hypothetical protein